MPSDEKIATAFRAPRRTRFDALSRGKVTARGEMNRTESAYAAELDAMIAAGQLLRYWFEPFSLRLSNPPKGQPARYTPDFLLLFPDGRTVIVDVKTSSGFDDFASGVRIKCAAEQFPLWEFWRVRRKRKKDGGGWTCEEV